MKADMLLMGTMPLKIVDRIDNKLLKETGRIKATEKVSLADAFAAALAIVTKPGWLPRIIMNSVRWR